MLTAVTLLLIVSSSNMRKAHVAADLHADSRACSWPPAGADQEFLCSACAPVPRTRGWRGRVVHQRRASRELIFWLWHSFRGLSWRG